ncbi:MAG: NADH-quinone oxidoreductase subunit M [Candidatus Methanomethylophilaceae archaeon]|jgi:NADH-quinone oxidoreductase subunit M|nr:NADH-quinone oxidoreductase subunit M [Candidatus Methanomethylophilaceae archaeon]NLF33588.1 NADH-quinone oxidoreductase subunit M [Thermoplasmatales archaeon]
MEVQIPLLTILLVLPFIGAIATLFMGGERAKSAKYVAGAFAGITALLSLLLFFANDLSFYDECYGWIDTAGLKMSFALGVDGLSMLMVFLTSVTVFLVILFSAAEKDRPNYFHTLILAMEVGLLGVYMAQDYFLFYIMWELTLVPMYFMISWYGGPRRHYAAIKFFIYTHVASLVMLIGIFALAFNAAAITGGGYLADFSFAAVAAASPLFGTTFQILVFGLLFFGFAVKMPIVPFHTWLPDAHVEAPTGGSVILAAVMLKMGSYGIIRVCLEVLPEGAVWWQPIVILIALLSIVYGAFACIAQTDLKKMVAFSSISHMGMVLLGIGCLSDAGVTFAIFQMFAHGLITTVLFMVCGLTGHNAGTREIPLLGGLAAKMPIYSAFMMFGFMASLGLPGLVGFWGEFGVIFSFYEYTVSIDMIWLIIFCLLSLLLTSGYYIWAMQRTLFGKETDKIDVAHVHDVSLSEGLALGVVCALIALFGLWPDLALGVIQTFSQGFISGVMI